MSNPYLPSTRGVAPESDSDIAYFERVTARVRRSRGTPTQGKFFRLSPDVSDQIDAYSEQFGVPTWAIVEAAIRAAQPGSNGIPDGWELPEAATVTLFDSTDLNGGHVQRKSA